MISYHLLQVKQAYFDYMVTIATLLGTNNTFAKTEMADVLEFETKLANVSQKYQIKLVTCKQKVKSSMHYKFYFVYCIIRSAYIHLDYRSLKNKYLKQSNILKNAEIKYYCFQNILERFY